MFKSNGCDSIGETIDLSRLFVVRVDIYQTDLFCLGISIDHDNEKLSHNWYDVVVLAMYTWLTSWLK